MTRLHIPLYVTRPHTISQPFSKIQLRLWRENSDIILITPKSNQNLEVNDIKDCLQKIKSRGFCKATTAAIPESEIWPYKAAGFKEQEYLYLLSRPTKPDDLQYKNRYIVKYRKWHSKDILKIDDLSFDSFWNFDQQSLHKAFKAAPRNNTYVYKYKNKICGFCICGRSSKLGFIQRLAVHPDYLKKGIATSLLNQSFSWLAKKNVHTSMVNTQEFNMAALNLYKKIGYQLEPSGLVVMRWKFNED